MWILCTGEADCEQLLPVAGSNIPFQIGTHVCRKLSNFSIAAAVPVASDQFSFRMCGSGAWDAGCEPLPAVMGCSNPYQVGTHVLRDLLNFLEPLTVSVAPDQFLFRMWFFCEKKEQVASRNRQLSAVAFRSRIKRTYSTVLYIIRRQ